jgi:hypothetical protein
MELFSAHKQWSTRPDDQRFTSLQQLYDATRAYAATAHERENVRVDSLRVENVDGDVQILGKGNQPARLTHWAFGQLAARVGAPAGYLRELPATLAAQNLNHGLASRVAVSGSDSVVNLLVHANGSLLLRALTSDRYERIWNHEVASRLLDLQSRGWRPAQPDIRVIDDRLPLYASDHDLYAFVSHSERTIAEPGNPDGLQRGLICENSEVGAGKLKLTRFLYREMCGNHIIWGAKDVTEVALRHVGKVRDRLRLWDTQVRRYLDESASEDEAKIKAAKSRMIAATKEQVLDALFADRRIGLSRKAIAAGYDAVVPEQDGDPRSTWGYVQGLTRSSQATPFADARMAIDTAAGRVLEAF